MLFILASSTIPNVDMWYLGQYVHFGKNNKKGMFVPDCAYHWHVSSHFMLLKC